METEMERMQAYLRHKSKATQ